VALLALVGAAAAWPLKKGDDSIEGQLAAAIIAKGGKLVSVMPCTGVPHLRPAAGCSSALGPRRAHQHGRLGGGRGGATSGPQRLPVPPPTAAAAARCLPQKGCKVGRECPTCLRGIVATKDFKTGDRIMKVPFKAVMRLK
jgi:hypothetical protein